MAKIGLSVEAVTLALMMHDIPKDKSLDILKTICKIDEIQ